MPSPLIEIPSDDIFKHDRLGLEPAIASRTKAILSRSPQAIAIDGHWGTGKSTFMALWAAYLRHEGVKVVQFNAWKAFGADPLDTLTKEILRQVDIESPEQKRSHERLLAFLKSHASVVTQGVKLASLLHPGLEGVSEIVELGTQSMGNLTIPEANQNEDPKIDSPEAFTSLLSSAAKTSSYRPIVVMVDELDRCNPDYSVEMLQLLEHIFCAEHVVFVVAVNLAELTHSVRAFYGQGFNAEGYLERFFDDILPLPSSNRPQYIVSSLNSTMHHEASDALPFLEASGLSLREINKATQQLRSAIDAQPNPTRALISLWIARTLAPSEYRQFKHGGISDKALADAVFGNGTCVSLRTRREDGYHSRGQQMELILIASSLELHRSPDSVSNEDRTNESELFRYHSKIAEDDGADGEVSVEYSNVIVSRARRDSAEVPFQGDIFGVQTAVRLLDGEPPHQ